MNSSIAELLANPYVPRVLTVILGATLIFFVVISVVLLYHWKKYESITVGTFFITIIYFAGSVILFGGAAYYLSLFVK